MRTLILIAIFAIVAYVSAISVLSLLDQHSIPTGGPIRTTLSELAAEPSGTQAGHVFEMTAKVTNAVKLGRLEAVTLGDDANQITVLSNEGDSMPTVGQVITVRFIATEPAEFEGIRAPLIYIKLADHSTWGQS